MRVSDLAGPVLAEARSFASGPERDARYHARRIGIAAAVVLAHALLIALVLWGGWTGTVQRPRSNLVAIDVSAPDNPSTPARAAKTPPVKRAQLVIPLPSTAVAAAPPAATGNGTGSGCATSILVARAITASPDAMAALAALPADLRTEADAVMLWNGAWLPTDAPEGELQAALSGGIGSEAPVVVSSVDPLSDPYAALKQVVIDALVAAPPECLNVDVVGPQLIPIPEPGRTTMLVVGSGVWRWSSIVTPPVEPGATPSGSQAAPWSPVGRPTGN